MLITFAFVSVLLQIGLCHAHYEHWLSKRLLTLDGLFSVKTNGRGQCSQAQVTDIRAYILQASTLADAALNALNQNPQTDFVRDTLTTYVGVTPRASAARTRVKEKFQLVRDWLDNGRLGESGAYPAYLYCDSTWAARVDPSEDAYREREVYEPLPDLNGPETEWDEYEEYTSKGTKIRKSVAQAYQKQLGRQIDGVTGEPFIAVPYWAADVRSYVIEREYTGGTYCGEEEHLAGTDTVLLPNILTLCPDSFGRGTQNLGDRQPVQGDSISEAELQPRGFTFFHELFHLVAGTAQTKDFADDAEECRGLSQDTTTRTQAQQSPECLALFALAQWFNSAQRPANQRVDFRTTIAA